MANEREEVISMIRACLLSVKGELSILNLNKDYCTMVGKHIPYQSLGFTSLLGFIKSVDEIDTVVGSNGDTMLTAAASSSTNHIAKMVARQKGPKKFSPRYVNADRRGAATWKKPAESGSRSSATKPPNSRYLGRNYDPNYRWRPSGSVSEQRDSYDCKKDPTGRAASYEVPPRFKNRTPTLSPTESVWDEEECVGSAAASTSGMERLSEKTNGRVPVATEAPPTEDLKPVVQGMIGLTPIQLRLQAYQHQVQKEAEMKAASLVPMAGIATQSDTPFPNSHLTGNRLNALKDYAALNNFPAPHVVIEAHQSGVGYTSTIQVGIFWFVSESHQGQTPRACVENASETARATLVAMNLPVEEDYDNPKLPVNRLLKLIYQYEVGIWSTYLEKVYTDQYLEPPPVDWITMLCESTQGLAVDMLAQKSPLDGILQPKLLASSENEQIRTSLMQSASRVEPKILGAQSLPVNLMRPIGHVPNNMLSPAMPVRPLFRPPVYSRAPAAPFSPSPLARPRVRTSTSNHSASPTDLEVSGIQLGEQSDVADQPELPDDMVWDIMVTNVFAVDEVWVRLAGNKNQRAYHDMCNNMDIYYMTAVHPPAPVMAAVGNSYAILVESCWQRVKLLDLQPNGMANLLFIDQGDEELYPFSLCQNLHPSFRKLPAQAIRLVLAGLEQFNDPIYTGILIEILLGKTLVANVYTKLTDRSVVTLYNTDNPVDVNINYVLAERMSLESRPPTLPLEGQAKEVYVSHIDNDGSVYVVVECASFKFLHLLMFQLIDQPMDLDNARVTNITSRSRVFLAQFQQDDDFYRVVALAPPQNGKVMVRFIDHGHTDVLDLNRVYNLQKLSSALCQLPAQALKVLLHNLPSSAFTPRMATRLRELIPEDLLVLVKVIRVVDPATTEVEIFKRIQPDNMLVSVNNTLALDPSLQPSTEAVSAFASVRPRRSETIATSLSDLRDLLSALDSGELDSALTRVDGEQFPEAPTPCPLPPPVLPPLASHFDVHVPIVSNPHNFFVQPWSDGRHLEQMMCQMQAAYGGMPPIVPRGLTPLDIVVGCAYAGLHTDGNWYRVTALAPAQGMAVFVSFSDFGDLSVLPLSSLRFLEQDFQELARQAIKAKLWGIKPSYQDWAVIDCIHFQQLVGERDFVSVVMEKCHAPDKPDEIVVGLRLIDTSGDTDVYVDRLLVDQQKAVYTDEMLKQGTLPPDSQ